MTIWADPFCGACGRASAVRECAIPQRALVPDRRQAGAPASAMTRMRLCNPCASTVGVLPLGDAPTISGRN